MYALLICSVSRYIWLVAARQKFYRDARVRMISWNKGQGGTLEFIQHAASIKRNDSRLQQPSKSCLCSLTSLPPRGYEKPIAGSNCDGWWICANLTVSSVFFSCRLKIKRTWMKAHLLCSARSKRILELIFILWYDEINNCGQQNESAERDNDSRELTRPEFILPFDQCFE
jgi:hypothetical protein